VIRSLSPLAQWCLLIALSLALGLLFHRYHIPAALLLGPLVIGIMMSLLGATVIVPMRFFIAAQAILGCMIAQTLSPELLIPLKVYWPFILFVTVSTLCASTFVGWLLIRFSPLPGSTGAWGTAPGGASAMVAMSVDYGADMRLVAFIQYLRVLLVISTTAIVAHYMTAGQIQEIHNELIWFPPLTKHFMFTLIIACGGAWIGRRFSIPSGAMLIPMIIGAGFQSTGLVAIELPQWLLAFAYATIGLSVGLRFNISVLRLALKALPQIILSIAILMFLCTLLALMLYKMANVDFLTAFLATSPGGLDTVAIIAAGTGSELALIISIQTLRLFSVLFFGPAIARFLSRYSKNG
jgi:membrane AbrB-like protein